MTMKSIFVFLSAAALTSDSASAFASPSKSLRSPNIGIRHATSLSASSSSNDANNGVGRTFATSAIIAAYLLANVVSADAALAVTLDEAFLHSSSVDSSSVMMAARSGGRAGGRSTMRAMPRSSSGSMGGGSRTVINRSTTIVAPPPIVMGGGFGYGGGYGYGYDPTPGLIFHGINAIGNGIRESRQNDMIYQERSELAAAREREAEMASRIRQLELMQMQQTGGGGGQVAQPQITIVQPPAVLAQ